MDAQSICIQDFDAAKQIYQNCGVNTPQFSLDGVKTYARVVEAYDGDTIKVVLNIFGSLLKFTCRLKGIDTCEMKSKNPKCKELAVKARNRLLELICQKPCTDVADKKQVVDVLQKDVHVVWIQCYEMDKYGRLLVDVFATPASTTSFSTILVQDKLAYKYEGDTKLTEEQQYALLTSQ